MDFINHAFLLRSRLSEHNQQFRAGLDYGLVQYKSNVLTGTSEVDGFPDILATRLEEAATANQIICSETARNTL